MFTKFSPWSHVALRITRGGMATFFVDGVAVASKAGFSGFEPYSSRLRIGANNAGEWRGRFFIDDLRISGRALPAGSGSGLDEIAWNTSLSQSPNPGLRPPDLAKQWLRTHPFMISSWGATAGGSDMHLFTEANFNAALANRSGYQFLSAAGMDGHQLGAFTQLDDDAVTLVHIAHNSPRLAGWLIGDEIDPNNIPGAADVTEYIRTLDAERLTFAGLGSSGETYIDNVITTIKPDAVIHGWYWAVNPEILPSIDFYVGHFYELAFIRNKALQYGLPLLWYVQSFADINSVQDPRPYRYLPSESQLRMDLFSGLAYGVKGFIYYMFDGRLGPADLQETALLDKNGDPSPLYEPAKQANKEVLNVGKALRFLESTDVRFVRSQVTNPVPDGLTLWSAGAGDDTHIQNIQIVQQGTYKDALIGFFKDDRGQNYFMLVNLYQGSDLNAAAATLNFNITFDSSVTTIWRLRRSDGMVESVAVPSHTLSLALPGGTGDLFKYDNGNFQLSGCADSDNPYPGGDLDGDCFVGLNDFATLSQNWIELCATPGWCASCDLNMDGDVGLTDFVIMAGNWLACSDPFTSCN